MFFTSGASKPVESRSTVTAARGLARPTSAKFRSSWCEFRSERVMRAA